MLEVNHKALMLHGRKVSSRLGCTQTLNMFFCVSEALACHTWLLLLADYVYFSAGHWICLDTAHTVASCEAMVNAALRIFPKSSSRALIVGLAADKNMEGIVRSLAILQPSLVLCVAPDSCGLGARGQPAEEVSSAFHRALGCDGDPSDAEKLSADYSDCKMPSVHTVSSMDEALRKVEMWAQGSHVAVSLDGDDEVPDESAKNDRAPLVCVTGSNYVVGAAIKSLQEM